MNDLTKVSERIHETFTRLQVDGNKIIGQSITTGTQVLIQLSFTDSTYEQLEIINDVIKTLGIDPEDFYKLRRNVKKHMACNYDQDEEYSFEKGGKQ